MSAEVLVFGDALCDRQFWVASLPRSGCDEKIISCEEHSGGSALNMALDLAALGVNAALCAALGDDEAGRRLLVKMRNAGIDTTLVSAKGETGYTITLIEPSGERTMLSYRGASEASPCCGDEVEAVLNAARIFIVSGYTLTTSEQAAFTLEAAKVAKHAGALVFFDAAPVISHVQASVLTEMLNFTDVFSPNLAELFVVAHTTDVTAALDEICATVPCVALKMGSRGALLRAKRGFLRENGEPLERDVFVEAAAGVATVADSTGAGDAFNAGFAAAWLAGGEPDEWLEKAVSTASRVVSQKGAALS